MKFSRSLQFNCVPEWSEQYLSFQSLKALSHQIEAARERDPKEAAALEEKFLGQYNEEVKKILAFYKKTYAESMVKYNALQGLVAEWSGAASAEVSSVLPRREHRPSLLGEMALFKAGAAQGEATEVAPEFGFKFDDQAKEAYLALHDLHEYLYMNHTGFGKLAKSLDKHAGRHQSAELMAKVDAALPMETLVTLETMMQEIERAYARICCDGNLDEATVYLRHLLHERIIYERASIWQELVAAERKAHEVTVVSSAPTAAAPAKKSKLNVMQLVNLAVCLAVFLVLLFVPILQDRVMQNSLALMVTASALWCTEVLPLYITSLMVPVMVIALGVLKNPDGTRMGWEHTMHQTFGAMFTPVIMLLLGGFAMAAALSKNNITKAVATAVLSRVGRRPAVVLFATMGVTNFLSMWISNVAAPVIVFTVIGPILRTLGADHPLAKALVLGVAYAANIGGMVSPISSPQNLIISINAQISEKEPAPGWLEWLAFATPTAWISLGLICLVLRFVYPCSAPLPESCVLKASGSGWTRKQYFVSAVAFLTVALWMFSEPLKPFIGGMGPISIVPLIIYFGTGILGKEDFNGFQWNIVALAMGGASLGNAIKSSGLLRFIGETLTKALGGFGQYMTVSIFAFAILIITTFISHTVGATIFLPLIKEVGMNMADPHPRLFVIVCGLMTSAGMGMPISGFPNINAVSQEDATGRNYIGTMDFVKTGLLGSLFTYLTIVSVGYGITKMLGY
jgi:phosphate transporter